MSDATTIQDQLSALVESEADKLLRYFRGSRLAYEVAQDLVQSTFEVFLGKDIAAIEKPREFLWGIARKKLLQHRERLKPIDEFRSSQAGAHSITSPSQRLDRRLRVQLLLARLDEEERSAFLMRCEGFTLEAIAESMGLGLATVKRRLAEARRHIEAIAAEEAAAEEKQIGRAEEPLSVEDVEDSYRRD